MRESISTTAEFGDYTRGPRVIGPASRAAMKEVLTEIQSGQFATELEHEIGAGMPSVKIARVRARTQLIETVGKALRKHLQGPS